VIVAAMVVALAAAGGGYLARHWKSLSCSQPIQQDQKSGPHYCVVLFD
jgi:hypothetical protein